ncbi:MAG: threonine ammonia-lyase [Vulcanimicrobiaceae bacterium]
MFPNAATIGLRERRGGVPPLDAVRAAAARLAGIVQRTPVVRSRTLDESLALRAFLKCEQFQRTGSFKFRGAYNRIALLGPEARRRGVVAFSSGNHAQAVALAARLLETAATIVVPADAPTGKLAATRGYGAEVIVYDRASEDRQAIAQRLAAERGATLVPPFDDPDIIAGAGTVGHELLEDVPELDAIVVPVGGGGLISGIALAAAALRPGIAIWGVEPEAGDDFARSLARGERIGIAVPATIADGQRTTSPGALTFEIVRERCAGIVTVSDAELCEALHFAFARLKLVLEPSGACALAALRSRRLDLQGQRVGVVLSGGNVDPGAYAEFVARGATAER